MTKIRKKRELQHIEVTPNMRSFAFLRLQAAISHLHNLQGSVELYNEFPHTLKTETFFEFAYKNFNENKYPALGEETAVEFLMRLDLGRNRDFLDEMAFSYLINSFITYCADILAVAALGSPEKFDLKVRLEAAKLARLPSQSRIMREVVIAVVSQITFMSYPELRKLLLSKVTLSKSAHRQLAIIDKAVQKRNTLTHGLGISRLAVDMHQTGKWRKREKVTQVQLNSIWNAIVKLSPILDKLLMKNFDVWRGVDICAPGLYRYEKGQRILQEDF
jgi:hypothetical protein